MKLNNWADYLASQVNLNVEITNSYNKSSIAEADIEPKAKLCIVYGGV